MYQSTLKKVGGSTMFAIPKAILEILDLHANETVGLSVADGKLVIEKRPQRKYTLDELLDQCDFSLPMTDEERVWLNDAPRGRELL